MSVVYVAVVIERHSDPTVTVWTSERAAVDHARDEAEGFARDTGDLAESTTPGWLYYVDWSPEGDYAWVERVEVQA